ncbi:hypothetical protein BS50DRAFT_187108 [Corynespora cassiicola Philippines]|uniref:Uncharacterized protein n=1 Tax=Corynespora cassiicola Philippines TaxID=1448308 RepID=A0A2T2P6X2_CORCC|nr:hypothetical protein BS50DRAFT_187108 [Corynespora cassiicola Philippines]
MPLHTPQPDAFHGPSVRAEPSKHFNCTNRPPAPCTMHHARMRIHAASGTPRSAPRPRPRPCYSACPARGSRVVMHETAVCPANWPTVQPTNIDRRSRIFQGPASCSRLFPMAILILAPWPAGVQCAICGTASSLRPIVLLPRLL